MVSGTKFEMDWNSGFTAARPAAQALSPAAGGHIRLSRPGQRYTRRVEQGHGHVVRGEGCARMAEPRTAHGRKRGRGAL